MYIDEHTFDGLLGEGIAPRLIHSTRFIKIVIDYCASNEDDKIHGHTNFNVNTI